MEVHKEKSNINKRHHKINKTNNKKKINKINNKKINKIYNKKINKIYIKIKEFNKKILKIYNNIKIKFRIKKEAQK